MDCNKTSGEKLSEIQDFLVDREAEDFAEAAEYLPENKIDLLYQMFRYMKENRQQNKVICFALKHDINGFAQEVPDFKARCESMPYL
jgi:hypothetical protein